MKVKNFKKVLVVVLTNSRQFVWTIGKVEVVSRSSVIADIRCACSVS